LIARPIKISNKYIDLFLKEYEKKFAEKYLKKLKEEQNEAPELLLKNNSMRLVLFF
jgi:hypothetical protein